MPGGGSLPGYPSLPRPLSPIALPPTGLAPGRVRPLFAALTLSHSECRNQSVSSALDVAIGRTIPARAGNGGRSPKEIGPSDGSSPHARGTVPGLYLLNCADRIIPARAGNGCHRAGRRRPLPDHPRTRGERPTITRTMLSRTGSSPHTRGTDLPPGTVRHLLRIIPAGAGNGWASPAPPRLSGDIPAHVGNGLPISAAEPLARIIPARAGSGRTATWRPSRSTDNPRTHGERPALAFGTGQGDHRSTAGTRIIPIGAGNGPGVGPRIGPPPNHPRTRGERTIAQAEPKRQYGSSPPTWGTGQH